MKRLSLSIVFVLCVGFAFCTGYWWGNSQGIDWMFMENSNMLIIKHKMEKIKYPTKANKQVSDLIA